jgi:hypothetical protein
MRSSRARKQAALAVVAGHLRATLEQGSDPRDTHLIIAGKRIAVEATAADSQVSRSSRNTAPRLRFDRVALGLLERLRAAVRARALNGATVVTITAPIRLPSRTAATLEESIQLLVGRTSARRQLTTTVHGNRVRIAILQAGRKSGSKLIGFVHNRDSDPQVLFELTSSLLRRIGTVQRSRAGFSGERWLVVAYEEGPQWIPTYRHICSQLVGGRDFQRILLVGADGRVSTLAE